MDDSNVPLFAQAKLEYTKQLVDVLYMNMYDGIRSIYDDSKQLYARKATTSIIYVFRSLLEKVPKWNTEIIDSETERIMKASKCDWLDDLLTAVFISHTRILMSIGPNQNYNKINVTIPKTTTFIHKSYINVAREVWKNPYLFNDNVPGHEYQRNMKQLEDMIKLTIEDTIRRQLPIKEILREHLETYDEPKQTTQKPIDMKMIMDEIKKATSNQKEEEEEEAGVEEDTSTPVQYYPGEVINESPNDIVFSKEEEEEEEEKVDTITTSDTIPDTIPDTTSDITNMDDKFVDPYKDPHDPDEEQIRNATQNIILNDITEPVVEDTYDNTDIISESIKTNKDDTTKKLSDMMNELNKPTTDIPTTNIPVSDSNIKPVTTDKNIKPKLNTSVIKIDDPTIPSIIKLDEVKLDEVKLHEMKPDENKPNEIKLDQEKSDHSVSRPFSFSNLYPNISGQGKVEDITQNEVKKDEVKDLNASIMKEVISLDKKEDEIDETITLDNFFNDVKKMTDPMSPIKEETKYTLFEDANEKEP